MLNPITAGPGGATPAMARTICEDGAEDTESNRPSHQEAASVGGLVLLQPAGGLNLSHEDRTDIGRGRIGFQRLRRSRRQLRQRAVVRGAKSRRRRRGVGLRISHRRGVRAACHRRQSRFLQPQSEFCAAGLRGATDQTSQTAFLSRCTLLLLTNKYGNAASPIGAKCF
jgi:hypothetical protein